MKMIKLTLLLVFIFLIQSVVLGDEISSMDEFLCDLGIHYYLLGRYEDAADEFRKALLLNPRIYLSARLGKNEFVLLRVRYSI